MCWSRFEEATAAAVIEAVPLLVVEVVGGPNRDDAWMQRAQRKPCPVLVLIVRAYVERSSDGDVDAAAECVNVVGDVCPALREVIDASSVHHFGIRPERIAPEEDPWADFVSSLVNRRVFCRLEVVEVKLAPPAMPHVERGVSALADEVEWCEIVRRTGEGKAPSNLKVAGTSGGRKALGWQAVK